jgi:RNA:NAD 2'-phosphotransferase (TPT1/KptA family)
MMQDSQSGEWMIRASQGHTIKSVKDDDLLTKIDNPFEYGEVIHGTYKNVL